MSAVTLRRIETDKNMARFYRLDVQPDLFGGWSLIREWGRIGRSGTVKALPCPCEAEAFGALERQRRAKERRGYTLSAPARQIFWRPD
jgi:predicted DNA-binding WGR domain protein